MSTSHSNNEHLNVPAVTTTFRLPSPVLTSIQEQQRQQQQQQQQQQQRQSQQQSQQQDHGQSHGQHHHSQQSHSQQSHIQHLHSQSSPVLLSKQVSRSSTGMLRKMRTNSMSRVSVGKASVTSDNNSDVDSQETEEDVCFPMLREHVRINGVDFDQIDEFIEEQREENEALAKREIELNQNLNQNVTFTSSAALRYTPTSTMNERHNTAQSQNDEKIDKNTEDNNCSSCSTNGADSVGVTFGDEKINNSVPNGSNDYTPPDRFSFFLSNNEETIHAPDIPSLIAPGKKFETLFEEDETWWLDCTCPTDSEMKMLARAFGIHPLTAEDIRMQEAREKIS
ncbi:unnamed protein product [[Candida] boidinii]|uniref:Unnamed protein product n=1 Tax=Candida boidinii TaxID=5477 RepID=A0ACB5U1Z3_CANBO|nr:unnamed protein product [[Candida] boidinii]